ncbi:protein-disulfide reductase DsbD [Photobacterium sp. 1_MG-2023]|uniref:protein-disulfide reductase DsbD n=1 Tax=Photobacterium sp. 1_MG-2023 TaxID=3062646 RepID=UPI0026E47D2F|nr:protein-disulfide reductase DsbD [Photobacterium sp. 1_MG-2023]MDO6707880.1 protein-disulfide reductase DsbD [Photobacterium sp. 1_MG-2023]
MTILRHLPITRLFVFACLLLSLPLRAEFSLPGLTDNTSQNSFVPVDQAFAFNFDQRGDQLVLDWQVKPGYYLYQHQFSVTTQDAVVGEIHLPAGTPYKDEFFGEVNIYPASMALNVPIKQAGDNGTLTVRYQGCAKAGFCYPPETREVPLFAVAGTPPGSSEPVKANLILPAAQAATATNPANDTQSRPDTAAPQSRQDQLASELAEQWWTPLLFLALGIGLAFTPCVLPMYPILTGIVLGRGQLSTSRTLTLAFTYVQGMALTYTVLGLVVASAGLQFQAALQHPYVLIGLSALFVLLALSMFGAYTLQLPSSVQTWLNQLSNQQKGGQLGGVFAMGAISGLVCSPCTTAPLSGALIYVAQSGDLLTGAVALYALAIGMGIPLILVAMFGNRLLPKAGAWMDRVKAFFGFVLLAVPLFLLERILPDSWMPFLWAGFGLSLFGWLYHVKQGLSHSWRSSLVGVVAIVGLLGSLLPIYQTVFQTSGSQAVTAPVPDITFQRVADMAELDAALAQAKAEGKPVMLDFYADWCVACKEFDKYTFHDASVAPQLQRFVLLQADVTQSTPDDIKLLQKMNVLGLPTLDFWHADGDQAPKARLTGFVGAEPFLDHLKANQLIAQP